MIDFSERARDRARSCTLLAQHIEKQIGHATDPTFPGALEWVGCLTKLTELLSDVLTDAAEARNAEHLSEVVGLSGLVRVDTGAQSPANQ